MSGSMLAAPAYELSTVAGPVIGSIAGAVATGIIYGAGMHTSMRKEFKQAIAAWRNFKTWLAQPENGAIAFPLEMPEGYQPLYPSYYVSLTEDERHLGLSHGFPVHDLKQAAQTEHGKKIVAQTGIEPIMIIKEILALDKNPVEFWNESLQESVRTTANAAQSITNVTAKIKAAKDRADFTGVENEREMTGLWREKEAAENLLFHTVLDICDQYDRRREQQQEAARIRAARAHIAEVINGDAEESHPLELSLQVLYSVASEALSKLDLAAPDSDKIAKDLGTYLKGTRKRLVSRDQMEQFYTGMRKQFEPRLPAGALPEWEDVARRLPVAET